MKKIKIKGVERRNKKGLKAQKTVRKLEGRKEDSRKWMNCIGVKTGREGIVKTGRKKEMQIEREWQEQGNKKAKKCRRIASY